MAFPENPDQYFLSSRAVALAAGLSGRYKDMAIGRARMLLYAALNNQDHAQIDLIAQACFAIMKQDRFVNNITMEVKMQDTDRVSQLRALAASLDTLITFVEEEDDFLLAAKLSEVRVRFSDRYTLDDK